jgi:hypothetical protein
MKYIDVSGTKAYNNRIQLTVKSVMFFAMQKNTPLFTASDAGVIRTLPLCYRA